jgi:hypothetical protein
MSAEILIDEIDFYDVIIDFAYIKGEIIRASNLGWRY